MVHNAPTNNKQNKLNKQNKQPHACKVSFLFICFRYKKNSPICILAIHTSQPNTTLHMHIYVESGWHASNVQEKERRGGRRKNSLWGACNKMAESSRLPHKTEPKLSHGQLYYLTLRKMMLSRWDKIESEGNATRIYVYSWGDIDV